MARVKIKIGIGDHLEADPQVTLRYSHDGGHFWSHHLPRSIGGPGEFDKQITWNRLGSGREWVFELTIVEPIPFVIMDAVAKPTELED